MNTHAPQQIAVFRTDRIGEVLLSTVAVDILHRNYPTAQITFFTSEYAAGVLSGHPGITRIVPLKSFKPGQTFRPAVRLAGQLRKTSFDMAVILNPHKALHLACLLAGIPRRCGFDRKWGFLLTRRVLDTRDQGEAHEVEYTRRFLKDIGLAVTDAQPFLRVEDGMRELIQEILSEQGVNLNAPIVVLHPCASNPAKCWSLQKYSALMEFFKDASAQVVVIGEQKEYDLISDLIDTSGCRAINAAGLFDLGQLAGLLQAARVFVGNDSGPMHMAAVLGVPVVAIFSKHAQGSNPVRWRPWGDDHVIFHELHGEKPCKLQHFSGYYIPKDDVSAGDVMEMLKTKLTK